MSENEPPRGLFESIFDQIWVLSLLYYDIITISYFQALLRLGFWVPFLLSFMVFFAWGTFLTCQSYW